MLTAAACLRAPGRLTSDPGVQLYNITVGDTMIRDGEPNNWT